VRASAEPLLVGQYEADGDADRADGYVVCLSQVRAAQERAGNPAVPRGHRCEHLAQPSPPCSRHSS
jgi:hypothetical protein